MLQLARQTASQDDSQTSLVASPVSSSRQCTAPPSYRSRQNTIETSPSGSSSLAVISRPTVPPRRPVPCADTGAHRHPELRGNRITELDQGIARREIPRKRPVSPPVGGAINPVLVREPLSAGRDNEDTLVGSEPRSPTPRPLAPTRTSEHGFIQSSSARRRTSVPTQQSQQTLQRDGDPCPRPRRKPENSPAQQSGIPQQSTRLTRQETRQPDMTPFTASGGGATGGASKGYQQSQGGNHDGSRRPAAQANMQAPPPDYTQSSQGARGGQRFSNTNAKLRQGGRMVASTLNQWDEKAQDTSPYTAALIMVIVFATIWGTGLITFGLIYYHKFRRLPYEDLFFKNEQGFQVNTPKGGKKERLFILVVMLAGAFVIKVVYILFILQAKAKYKGWGLYRWAKETQQAYHKRRDERHAEKARQRQLDAVRHNDEIGRGQDGWEGPSQHQLGQMPQQQYQQQQMPRSGGGRFG